MAQYLIETDEEADAFLSCHKTVRLVLRKYNGGWAAVIEGSDLRPMPHGLMPKRQLQLILANRYLAEVYNEAAYVNLEWLRRHPGWASNLGGLPEIARPILIMERTLSGKDVNAKGEIGLAAAEDLTRDFRNRR